MTSVSDNLYTSKFNIFSITDIWGWTVGKGSTDKRKVSKNFMEDMLEGKVANGITYEEYYNRNRPYLEPPDEANRLKITTVVLLYSFKYLNDDAQKNKFKKKYKFIRKLGYNPYIVLTMLDEPQGIQLDKRPLSLITELTINNLINNFAAFLEVDKQLIFPHINILGEKDFKNDEIILQTLKLFFAIIRNCTQRIS